MILFTFRQLLARRLAYHRYRKALRRINRRTPAARAAEQTAGDAVKVARRRLGRRATRHR